MQIISETKIKKQNIKKDQEISVKFNPGMDTLIYSNSSNSVAYRITGEQLGSMDLPWFYDFNSNGRFLFIENQIFKFEELLNTREAILDLSDYCVSGKEKLGCLVHMKLQDYEVNISDQDECDNVDFMDDLDEFIFSLQNSLPLFLALDCETNSMQISVMNLIPLCEVNIPRLYFKSQDIKDISAQIQGDSEGYLLLLQLRTVNQVQVIQINLNISQFDQLYLIGVLGNYLKFIQQSNVMKQKLQRDKKCFQCFNDLIQEELKLYDKACLDQFTDLQTVYTNSVMQKIFRTDVFIAYLQEIGGYKVLQNKKSQFDQKYEELKSINYEQFDVHLSHIKNLLGTLSQLSLDEDKTPSFLEQFQMPRKMFQDIQIQLLGAQCDIVKLREFKDLADQFFNYIMSHIFLLSEEDRIKLISSKDYKDLTEDCELSFNQIKMAQLLYLLKYLSYDKMKLLNIKPLKLSQINLVDVISTAFSELCNIIVNSVKKSLKLQVVLNLKLEESRYSSNTCQDSIIAIGDIRSAQVANDALNIRSEFDTSKEVQVLDYLQQIFWLNHNIIIGLQRVEENVSQRFNYQLIALNLQNLQQSANIQDAIIQQIELGLHKDLKLQISKERKLACLFNKKLMIIVDIDPDSFQDDDDMDNDDIQHEE